MLTNYITNQATTAREENKLKHDAEQKELERKFELKVAQYLSAIAAINKLQVKVSRIADTPLDEIVKGIASEGLQDAFAGMSLVSPMGVMQSSANCAVFWSTEFMGIMVDRLQIETLEDVIKKWPNDPDTTELFFKVLERKNDLRRKCMAVSLGMQERCIPLVKEMRKDLDLAIDGRAYEEFALKNLDTIKEAFEVYLKRLTSEFLDHRAV